MTRLTYTKRNIEDWDFRHTMPRRLPTDFEYDGAGSLFLMENYTEVLLVDHTRSIILKSMLDHEYAVFNDDREAILLTDFGEKMVGCHGGFIALLSGSGRRLRRVSKALTREWHKYGKLRLSVLPPPDA